MCIRGSDSTHIISFLSIPVLWYQQASTFHDIDSIDHSNSHSDISDDQTTTRYRQDSPPCLDSDTDDDDDDEERRKEDENKANQQTKIDATQHHQQQPAAPPAASTQPLPSTSLPSQEIQPQLKINGF